MANKKLNILILTSLLSITLVLLFGILKIYSSPFLKLESRWLLVAAIPVFIGIIYSGLIHRFKALGVEYESAVIIEATTSKRNLAGGFEELGSQYGKESNKLPADYIYLNHTSFLRVDRQEEFKKRTGVNRDHFDIRVVVNSYYKGALDRITYVEYYLHKAYPEPIQKRYNKTDHFLLKEIANGEYVLVAKVFLNDLKEPIILERYITLYKEGPKIT